MLIKEQQTPTIIIATITDMGSIIAMYTINIRGILTQLIRAISHTTRYTTMIFQSQLLISRPIIV